MSSLARQRGALNLAAVGIGSVLLAVVAMAALFSMRSERNLFAEGAAKVTKMVADSPASGAVNAAKAGLTGKDGQMRTCVIKGEKVISNSDCTSDNKTSKVMVIHDTRGFEIPKKAPEHSAEPTSDKMIDKMIEKQTQ